MQVRADLSTTETSCVCMLKLGGDTRCASITEEVGEEVRVVGGEGCPAGELFLSLSELLGC